MNLGQHRWAVVPPRGEGLAIKGFRHGRRYDVGRLWECPLCGRHERTGGQVVNRACTCRQAQEPDRVVWMRLVERPSRPRCSAPPAEGPAAPPATPPSPPPSASADKPSARPPDAPRNGPLPPPSPAAQD